MPQKKSYFALKLPLGWWIFGLDLALHGDIDVYQFEFFSKLARKTVFFVVLTFNMFTQTIKLMNGTHAFIYHEVYNIDSARTCIYIP
jgi:hypothetical protein